MELRFTYYGKAVFKSMPQEQSRICSLLFKYLADYTNWWNEKYHGGRWREKCKEYQFLILRISIYTQQRKPNVTAIVLYSFTLHLLAKVIRALQKYGIINQRLPVTNNPEKPIISLVYTTPEFFSIYIKINTF